VTDDQLTRSNTFIRSANGAFLRWVAKCTAACNDFALYNNDDKSNARAKRSGSAAHAAYCGFKVSNHVCRKKYTKGIRIGVPQSFESYLYQARHVSYHQMNHFERHVHDT
jgi:hypothetical protein